MTVLGATLLLLLASEPKSHVLLTDVTRSTGIDWIHRGGPSQRTNIRGQIGSGLALFDYDGDGWLDVYFLSGQGPSGQREGNRLYRNNRDGTFADVTRSAGVAYRGWSMGACVGDYNADGWPDLYITNLGANILYRNNGDGTFADVTAQAGIECPHFSTGAAFADYDRDGDLDLFVSNYVEAADTLTPTGEDKLCDYYGLRVPCGPRGLRGEPDFLYRNQGDGTFEDVSTAAGVSDRERSYGLGVTWSDIDDDGDQDLFVANDRGSNYLYLNDGKGRFEENALLTGVAVGWNGQAQACMGVDIVDFDLDGRFDLVVTNFSREFNAVYQNLGGGFFSDVSQRSGLGLPSLPFVAWGTRFFDVDSDGDLDLFVANGHTYPQVDDSESEEHYAQPNQLFLNLGGGKFKELAAGGTGLDLVQCSRGVAVGDFDNDGDVDVLVNNLDDTPAILRNDTRTAGHWLNVKLVGNAPNQLAIGALVTAVVGKHQLLQEIRSGGSYLSQSDLRLHFGLGQANRVDRLVIRWPDGQEQILEDLPGDEFLTVSQERD